MKKLLKSLSTFVAFLALTIGVSYSLIQSNDVVGAKAETLVIKTADFTTKSSNSTTYTEKWNYGSEWEIFGGANNKGQWNYVKFGGKKDNLAKANPCYLRTKSKIASPITEIGISILPDSFSKAGMSLNEFGVKVYTDSTFGTLIEKVSRKTYITGQNLFSSATSQSWPINSYYEVFFDLSNSSTTNGIVLVDKVNFLFTDSSDNDNALAFAENVNNGIGTEGRVGGVEGAASQCAYIFEKLKQEFGLLSEEAKTIFLTTGEGTEFEEARLRIAYLESYLNDSLEGTSAGVRSPMATSQSNNMMAIVTIGVIGLSALIGYYYINNKKQHN